MIPCPIPSCGGLAFWNAEEEVYHCLWCGTVLSEAFVKELELEAQKP